MNIFIKNGIILLIILIIINNIKTQKNEQKTINKTRTININNITIEKNQNNNNILLNEKLIISCAYSTDNAYVYPTLVAITSLVENASNQTFYEIYIMINPEFNIENKKILKSVEEKYITRCEVIFINMGDKFKNLKSNKIITTPTYYRLELHNLLPNIKRIIWMDGDTLVFEDLTELFNLNMKGNYIMGFLDSIPEAIDKFNIKNSTVICNGVLLLDLDGLRKNNITEKFNNFIIKNINKINQHDQTIINVVCQDKIGVLPPKYGMWNFEKEIYAIEHNERQRPHLKYNMSEFIEAYHSPAILHYTWPKPFWRIKRKQIFTQKWWEYADKTGYYNEIFKYSPRSYIYNQEKDKEMIMNDHEKNNVILSYIYSFFNICFIFGIFYLFKINNDKKLILLIYKLFGLILLDTIMIIKYTNFKYEITTFISELNYTLLKTIKFYLFISFIYQLFLNTEISTTLEKIDSINSIKICCIFLLNTFSYDKYFSSYSNLINIVKHTVIEYFIIIFYRYLKNIIFYISNNIMLKDLKNQTIYLYLKYSNNVVLIFISLLNLGNIMKSFISDEYFIYKIYIENGITAVLGTLKYYLYSLYIIIIFKLNKNDEYKIINSEENIALYK